MASNRRINHEAELARILESARRLGVEVKKPMPCSG